MLSFFLLNTGFKTTKNIPSKVIPHNKWTNHRCLWRHTTAFQPAHLLTIQQQVTLLPWRASSKMTKTRVRVATETANKNVREVCRGVRATRPPLPLRVTPPPASPPHLPLLKIPRSNLTPSAGRRRWATCSGSRMTTFCLLHPKISCQTKVKCFHLHPLKWRDDD